MDQHTPIEAICERMAIAFAALAVRATDGSPLQRARAALGEERFVEIACESVTQRTIDMVAGPRRNEALQNILVGPWGVALVQADIMAGVLQDLLAAGGVP